MTFRDLLTLDPASMGMMKIIERDKHLVPSNMIADLTKSNNALIKAKIKEGLERVQFLVKLVMHLLPTFLFKSARIYLE